MFSHFIRLALLFSTLLLSACASHAMLTGFSQMGNPLDIAPEEVVFAVRGPNSVRVSKQDIQLKISYTHQDLEQPLGSDFVFESEVRDVLPAHIAQDIQTQEQVSFFRFRPEDYERLKALQTQIQSLNQRGPRGKGSIQLSMSQGCVQGALPTGPIHVAVYAQVEEQKGFFTLTPRIDLRKIIQEAQGDLQKLPAC